MPGLWLTRIARRVTRPDTFEHLVSPAIADLQLEHDRWWRPRVRHYLALVAVMTCAMVQDFRTDVALAFDRDARRRIWVRAAVWSVAAGLCNWAFTYRVTMDLSGAFAGDPSASMALSLTGLRSLAPALTVAVIVAACGLRRRDSGARAVVAATAVMAMLALVVCLSAVAAESQFLMALELAAYPMQASSAPVAFRWPPLSWRMLTAAVSVIPFAWLGVVLARHRGWPVAAIATSILGAWVFANVVSLYLLGLLLRAMPVVRSTVEPLVNGTYAIPVNLLTLVALILMWRGVETGFDRLAGTR